jgi:hypothetical protein
MTGLEGITMKSSFVSEKYGTIVYEESFWTGRKAITVDGVAATKMDRKTFVYTKEGVSTTFQIKGSYFSGAKLLAGEESYQVVPATTWYEYALAILPFAFDIVWGNIQAVQQYFPIVGGFVGGLITGLAMVGSVLVSKLVKKPILKILIGLGFAVVAIGICYLIAFLLLKAVGK